MYAAENSEGAGTVTDVTDLAKRLAVRVMANGVDEARATKVAAELAVLLSCLHGDEKEMLGVEPAVRFTPVPVTPASGSA